MTVKWIDVADDGIGMSVADMNEKYLRVGHEGPDGWMMPKGRSEMSWKEFGKLALHDRQYGQGAFGEEWRDGRSADESHGHPRICPGSKPLSQPQTACAQEACEQYLSRR